MGERLVKRHKTDLHLARHTNNDGSGSRNGLNTFFRKGTQNENRFTLEMSSSGKTQGMALGNTANGNHVRPEKKWYIRKYLKIFAKEKLFDQSWSSEMPKNIIEFFKLCKRKYNHLYPL
jgi:hypothetical protein